MDQKQIQLIHAQISEVKIIGKKSVFAATTPEQVVRKEFIENEARVYNEALRHNIWLKEIDLIKWKYPNENKKIYEYRNNNKRQFTKEVPRKVIQGIISVLGQVSISVDSNNEKFNTWINSNPFSFAGSSHPFVTWSITYAFPYALIDPNAIIIPFPIFKGEFEVIGIEPRIIPHNKRYIDPKGEYFLILESDTKNYWYVDRESWWYVDNSKSVPEWTEIYPHKTGELPFEYLPGLNSFDELTKNIYFESLISSVYELLNESLVSFTSDQAIRLKLNPLLIRPGARCETCFGEGIIKKDNKEINCTTCKGSKLAPNISELEDIVIPPTDWIQGENAKIAVEPKYVHPDTSVAEFSGKTWKEFFQLAKDGVGIDSLIKTSESGEAMKQRLIVFQEFISSLMFWGYTMRFTSFFKICHKFLEKDSANWKDFPVIKIPKRVEIKTPEILKMTMDEAKGGDKIQAAKERYAALYSDNPTMDRAMKIIIDNYPAFLEEVTNYGTLIQNQVFTSQDFAKSKFVLQVITGIIKGLGTTEKTDEQIVIEAEKILLKKVQDRIEVV